MSKHYLLLSDAKQQYELLFNQARRLLDTQFAQLLRGYDCAVCADDGGEIDLAEAMKPRHAHCSYRLWQQSALEFIENTMGREIIEKLNDIDHARNQIGCHQCGVCCRMASVDAPYDVLQVRAAEGDEFARQFTSIFLPYASREAARLALPKVVDAVLAETEDPMALTEQVFFYHCPYVGEDNRCTVYGTPKRPALCTQYPETPLGYIYESCAWQPWKEKYYEETQMAHALLALCRDYQQKLKQSLETKPNELLDGSG